MTTIDVDPEPNTISGNTNMTDEHDTTTDHTEPKTLREIMSDRNDPDPDHEQTDDHETLAISDAGGGPAYTAPGVGQPIPEDYEPGPGHIQRAFRDENASAEELVDALNRVIGPHWIARLTGGRRRRHGERTLIIELGQPDVSDDTKPSHGLGRNPGDPDPEDEPPKRKSGFSSGPKGATE